MRQLSRPRVGRDRHRNDAGAAAVEFALVFCIILVPLVIGMLQYGWYFYTAQTTGSAARETARRLSVGDCQAAGQAEAFARTQSGLSTLTLTYGTPTTQNNVLPNAGQVLHVQATADGKIIGFLPLPNDGQVIRTVDAQVEDSNADSTC